MPEADFDPRAMLDVLVRHGVDFVLIGGFAGIVRGSSYNTQDVDIAYARTRENLQRLASALAELGASLRGAPADLPFTPDTETLEQGLNFTFVTRFGPLDVLGEPAGAPRFDELHSAGTDEHVAGLVIRVASLDHLIAMKEAAGRPHDKLMASEYRTIADELRRREGAPG